MNFDVLLLVVGLSLIGLGLAMFTYVLLDYAWEKS